MTSTRDSRCNCECEDRQTVDVADFGNVRGNLDGWQHLLVTLTRNNTADYESMTVDSTSVIDAPKIPVLQPAKSAGAAMCKIILQCCVQKTLVLQREKFIVLQRSNVCNEEKFPVLHMTKITSTATCKGHLFVHVGRLPVLQRQKNYQYCHLQKLLVVPSPDVASKYCHLQR